MANKRISELSSITGANLADADLLVVVDVSDTTMAASGTNKKITMSELAKDSALTDNLIAKTTLTTDGDVLTRAAGAPARITRADLAQDSAFSSRYAPLTAIYLPGTSGNNISTPDANDFDITGDLDLRAYVAMDDWTPSGATVLVSKWNFSTGRSYRMLITTSGLIQLDLSTDGSAEINIQSTTATGIADGNARWVRASIDVSNPANPSNGYEARFWTSTDGTSWSQLGNAVIGAASTSIHAGTATVELGSTSTTALLTGKYYRAQILNGINGTVVGDWNAAAHLGGPRSRDVTGKVWTINGSAWSGMFA